jgi:hypothetical protein
VQVEAAEVGLVLPMALRPEVEVVVVAAVWRR